MIIHSLEVESFGALRSVTIDHLAPGLNVIVGDNEAGKSTLLKALRAAFFQKHRQQSDTTRDFAPYDGAGRPQIALRFTIGGVDYALRKAFLTRPSAELSWPGGHLSGDAVEERLAELLRFSHPARQTAKTEHPGAFGLIWVDQGRSPAGLDIGNGRDLLAASLEGEVGDVVGGEHGRRMLAAARALQDRFWTAGLRTRSDSPLKLAEDEAASVLAALDAKRLLYRHYQDKLERLADRRARLARYDESGAVAAAEAALLRAQEAARLMAAAEGELQQIERDCAHARSASLNALQRLQERRALQKAQAQAQQDAADALAEADACRRQSAALADGLAALEAARAAAVDEERLAEQRDEEALAQMRLMERGRKAAALSRQRAAAQAVLDRLATLRAEDDPTAPSPDDVARMERLSQALREAQIRQNAASPVLRFEPADGAAGAATDADGRVIEPMAEIRVAGTARFHIAGYGSITVTAGGEARDLADTVSSLAADWQALTARTGFQTLEAARQAVSLRRERVEERRRLQAELSGLVPEGVPALDARIAELSPDARAAQAQTPSPDLEALRGARLAATRQREAAEAGLAERRAEQSAQAVRLARLEAALEHAQSRAQTLAAEHHAAFDAASDSALEDALADSERTLAAREAVLSARRRQFDQADGEAVRLERDRAGRARDQLSRTLRDLAQEIHGLEGELRVEGAAALEEEIARLEGEAEALGRRVARLRLEADAARLLMSTLNTHRSAARDAWLEPVKRRVAPYLRLVQPGGDLDFDDATLEIRSLTRNGVEEDFRKLSQGAREQIAIVTRMAMAEALRDAGLPVTLILDDALVNTDEKRLARMHLALSRAAEMMQVLVLTCRERDFTGLGAPIHRI
ncbi:AAA family ATPase [Aureimonas frigidaquae]|uniref:AAA family ATPase n=1 Tax=Aureimonas frigidaquae TaxID=424757 RepID=UPI0007810E34|nr:AAA family ATPase [Aureimonas frigidaquae]